MRYTVLSREILWLMDDRDERFRKDYQPVTRVVGCGGKLGRMVTDENGKRYRVLPDWSVMKHLPR
jgi:hypothetical protein